MYNLDSDRIPKSYRPLGAWTYFGLEILYAIPVVGLIFLICHAIGSENINKRNFARSFFCVYVLALIVIVALLVSGVGFSISGGSPM